MSTAIWGHKHLRRPAIQILKALEESYDASASITFGSIDIEKREAKNYFIKFSFSHSLGWIRGRSLVKWLMLLLKAEECTFQDLHQPLDEVPFTMLGTLAKMTPKSRF